MQNMELGKLKQNMKNFLKSDNGCATAAKVALAVIALGGILIIGALAPNIFQVFGKFRRGRRYSPQQLRSAVYGLERKGYVKILKERGDKIRIKITKRGKEKIKEFSFETLTIPKQKYWDKKWRIIIFDIPIKFNKAREALRLKLKSLGFYQVQKSVWCHPYPCEDEILFIANIFRVESFIEILTVEKLLNGERLKRFFKQLI